MTKTMTARLVTIFIRQTHRQTGDRQTKFLLQFLSPRGAKRTEKNFSSIGRKRILEIVAIYPLGLRTYKNKRESLIFNECINNIKTA